MQPDKESSEEQPAVAQPDSGKRIQVPRFKGALFQVTVVDAQGQRRSGVPVTVKRIIEGHSDIDETTETNAFGKATTWLTGLSDAETVKFVVAGQKEITIPANTIDPETLVSIKLPLNPDAPVKGTPAERIEPRREYSPPLARMLSSKEEYVTVPHTKGCDVPMPATQASSDFLIYQLVRRSTNGVKRADLSSINPINTLLDLPRVTTGVRFGDRVIYRQTWRLLGQSLGDLVYSLPLAPLESVNLAILEWSREDVARRDETMTATESLLHAQFRDRSVIETIATAVSEYQGGFSVIGAAAGGGPMVGAIGGGTSHSWGNRNLVGESVQQLSDAVQQASDLIRSQTGTVVIQASQAERDSLQTRTVSNYNQNHALTIQYYEVLRHFEVVTAFEALEPVLFVPFMPLRFDRETALRFRRILERNALDQRIPDWFDASERLGYSGNYPVTPEPAPNGDVNSADITLPLRLIERLQIKYITGDQTTVGYVKLEFGLRNGTWLLADDIPARTFGISPLLKANTDYISDITSGDAIGLDVMTVEQIRVTWNQLGLQDGWKFKGIEIRYALEGGNGLEPVPLFAKTANDALRVFGWESEGTWTSELFLPPQPTGVAQSANAGNGIASTFAPTRLTNLLRRIGIGGPTNAVLVPGANSVHQKRSRADDAAQELLLLEHLNANRQHYSRAVVLQMDGDERIRLLESVLGDTDLLRDIGFEPVGVSGHYVAFPYRGDRAPALNEVVLEDLRQSKPQTRHINLPTRGVFAETHLSHCPAREKRDPSRMYSPSETILPTAPTISGVQPGSRNMPTDTSLTPLPAPVVNIQNPAPAPDPAGLAAAFGLLGQTGLFRDMSTSQEVASLLGRLASGAISGEETKAAAKRIQAALAQDAGGAGSPTHPATNGSARDLYDRLQLLDQSNLPPVERARIQQNLLDPGATPADGVHFTGFVDSAARLTRESLVIKEGEGVADAVVFYLQNPVFDQPVQNRFGQVFSMSTGDFFGERLILWPRASDIWYLEGDRILSDRPDQFFSMLEFEAVLDKIDRMGWLVTMATVEMNFLIAFTVPLWAIVFGKGVGLLAHLADPSLRRAIYEHGPKVIAGIKYLRTNANECFGCVVKNAAIEAIKSIPSGIEAKDLAYIIGRVIYSGRRAIAKDTLAVALTPLKEIAKANRLTVPMLVALRAAGASSAGLTGRAQDLLVELRSQGIPVDGAVPCVKDCLAALLNDPDAETKLQELADSIEVFVPALETLLKTVLDPGIEM
jgi:hypothetical protein